MGTIALETGTSIYAWALMTSHAHIFLRSSSSGISRYMRRLLSGYVISYNRRPRRHGHLFQNRYKSIICEEDPYVKELIRYIHLNPLRANMVESLAKLDRYRYCGHSVLMGNVKNDWQNRDYVLKWFGTKGGEAKRKYRQFVKKGIFLGRRPELVGGGLIKFQGGWSAVKAMHSIGVRKKSDERILGSGEFVEQLIKQSDQTRKEQFAVYERLQHAASYVEKICDKENINVNALKSESRRRKITTVRSQPAKELVKEWGLSLTETGRHLGLSLPAIAKTIYRLDKHKSS